MSKREELAETISVALRDSDMGGYTDISDLSDAVLDSRYDLLAVADAVLADYQPKPRTVNSVEELEALPVLSVIRDAGHEDSPPGEIWEKWYRPTGAQWMRVGSVKFRASNEINLPATVIFIPEATA